MPQFILSFVSFRAPTLPPTPDNLTADVLKTPLTLPNTIRATSSMFFSISLPNARDTKDPLFPASHLQITYSFEGTAEIFVPESLTITDLKHNALTDTYDIEIPPERIPRPKVNHEATTDADVAIYAWKGDKLLGKWSVGRIAGLGFSGLKSHDLARSRVEARKAFIGSLQ